MKFTIITALILGTLLALIPHLIWILGRIFCHQLSYSPFGYTALALVGLLWITMMCGHLWGCFRYEVTHPSWECNEVPTGFKGYKIVHISDLHLGTFSHHPQKLQQIVDSINAQEPDLICFTGDILTMGLQEVKEVLPIISQMKAKDGIVSVLGNHDMFIYGRQAESSQQRNKSIEELASIEKSLGWNLLRNHHVILHRGEDSIAIAGVDNIHGEGQGFQTINSGDLTAALAGLEQQVFTILLSHDPSHWRSEVLDHPQIKLTLSGHTHAAQVRIAGWSPASWMFSEVQGFYQQDTQWLYVNRGIGCTIPLRIGCPAEITVITL